MTTYYDLLGVDPKKANRKAIEQGYGAMTVLDPSPGVEEAYRVLSSPDLRVRYDETLGIRKQGFRLPRYWKVAILAGIGAAVATILGYAPSYRGWDKFNFAPFCFAGYQFVTFLILRIPYGRRQAGGRLALALPFLGCTAINVIAGAITLAMIAFSVPYWPWVLVIAHLATVKVMLPKP
jgi:hypothetical protein